MPRPHFEGPVEVEIQGPRVLETVGVFGVVHKHVEYNVIGFQQRVKLRDYRRVGLQAIDVIERDNDAEAFLALFCTPAEAKIYPDSNGDLHIDLFETSVTLAKYMLWIAIGLEDFVPLYDYAFEQIEFLDNNHLALVSVYRRPRNAKNTNHNGQGQLSELFLFRTHESACVGGC